MTITEYPHPHDMWYEFSKEQFHEILEALGFYNVDSRFSGFCSQGDGASFSASYSYEKGAAKKIKASWNASGTVAHIADRLQELQRRNFYQLTATISTSGWYCHEMTMSASVERDSPDYREPTQSADDDLLEICRDLARWYYKNLELEFEYQCALECGREAAQQICEARESVQEAKEAKKLAVSLFVERNIVTNRKIMRHAVRRAVRECRQALEEAEKKRSKFHEWLGEYVATEDGFKEGLKQW